MRSKGWAELRSLPPQDTPGHVRVDVGAGQVRILAPRTMNLTVDANVHAGMLVRVEDVYRIDVPDSSAGPCGQSKADSDLLHLVPQGQGRGLRTVSARFHPDSKHPVLSQPQG